MLVVLDIWSVTDLTRPAALTRLGEAWETFPAVVPTRVGLTDPPRIRISSVPDYLVSLADEFDEAGLDLIFSTPPDVYTWLTLARPVRDGIRLTHLSASADADDRVARDTLAAFGRAMFDAMAAFYGLVRVAPVPIADFVRTRLRQAKDRGHRESEVAPGRDRLEYRLPDIGWVNYFGPAFVDRWGGALMDVGVRSEPLASGGRMVWAAEDPWELLPPGDRYDDWGGRLIEDVPARRPFLERLDRDAFPNDEPRQSPAGQHVPTFDEHLADGTNETSASQVTGTARRLPSSRPGADSNGSRAAFRPSQPALEAIAFYRPLGFFAHERGEDVEVAAVVEAEYALQWGGPFDPSEPQSELALIALDSARVWWEDLEADVAAGNGIYVDVVRRLAETSRGALRIESVTERWSDDGSFVEVDVLTDRGHHTLRPAVDDDWLDVSIVDALNRLMGGGIRFHRIETGDQTAAFVALSKWDRHLIRRARPLPVL